MCRHADLSEMGNWPVSTRQYARENHCQKFSTPTYTHLCDRPQPQIPPTLATDRITGIFCCLAFLWRRNDNDAKVPYQDSHQQLVT